MSKIIMAAIICVLFCSNFALRWQINELETANNELRELYKTSFSYLKEVDKQLTSIIDKYGLREQINKIKLLQMQNMVYDENNTEPIYKFKDK